jgi:hypothetical protein
MQDSRELTRTLLICHLPHACYMSIPCRQPVFNTLTIFREGCKSWVFMPFSFIRPPNVAPRWRGGGGCEWKWIIKFYGGGIAQSVWQRATDWSAEELGLDSWQEQEVFLFSTTSRPALAPTPASYPMSAGGEAQGREGDYSPSSRTEAKNGGAIPSLFNTF